MAETIGSLIDKLAIVDLKLWHCQEALFNAEEKPPEEIQPLKTKNESLLGQRQRLIHEIDEWFVKAINEPGNMILTNPSNKMYGRFRKD
jgi:hypothetical protein